MTDHYNALRGTLTSGGTGNVTISDTASGRGSPLTELPAGWKGGLRFDDMTGTAWELSDCTVVSLNPTVVSRDTVRKGSSGSGAKVTLTVGMTVQQVPTAEQLNAMLSVADIPFSAAIPLTRPGHTYMAAKTVTGPLTLTPAANAVRGALVYGRFVADGTNVPDCSAWKEWGGSMGYDNRVGIENQVQFFFDGATPWISYSQAVGAVPAPLPATSVTLSGSSAGVVNTTTTFTAGTDGTRASAVIVTPTPVTGVTFNPTSVTLPIGSGTLSFTATPTSTGTKSIAVTNNAGLTSPSAITWAVAAAATAPTAPTIGTAVAGDGYVDVYFTRNSDGGSSVLDSTATLSSGQTGTGSASPIRVTASNGTTVTATVKDRNVVGNSAASSSSNSVTPAAVVYPRISLLNRVNESGTGPYIYASQGGAGSTNTYAAGSPGPGGVLTTHFQNGVAGSFSCSVSANTSHGEPIIGIDPSASLKSFDTLAYGIYGSNGSGYKAITAGSIATGNGASVTAASNDVLRVRRVIDAGGASTTLYVEVARASTPTAFTIAQTWTGVSIGVLYIHAMISGGYGETPSTLSNLTAIGLA